MTDSSRAPAPSSPTGWITFGLFVVIGGLFLGGVYLFLRPQPFWALFWVGILALVFALASYLAGALTPNPRFQRQLAALALVTLALASTVIAIGWRLRSIAQPPREAQEREAWRQSGGSPSAFSYTAAHSPSNPTPMPAPSAQNPPPPGGSR